MLCVKNVRRLSLWELRFAPISLFPNISLETINEYCFQLAYKFRISPFSFDYVDFLEFLTQYERLGLEEKRKEEQNNGSTNLMEMLGK